MSQDKKNGPPSTFLKELKRRKVVQFAIAYLIIAWVVVQVADVLLPAYGAPAWATQATITFLILAFPPALILAWLFNITTSGVEMTEDTRWSSRLRAGWIRWVLSSVTVVFTGVALWWVWQGYLREQDDWIRLDDSDGTTVVAVAPILNLSNDPGLDWLGDGLARLVRNRLAQSRFVITVSQPRWQTIVRDAEGPSETVALAADAEIDYIVSGAIHRSPDGLMIDAWVTDTQIGTDIESYSDDDLTAERILNAVYPISIMAKQALKVPLEEQVDSFAADFAVSNFAAYRAYINGLRFFLNFDYQQAENSMKAALQLAPDFQIARYRLAMLYWVRSERDKAAAAMQLIPDDARLNPRERGYVDAANAFIRDNDPAAAIERYKRLLQQFPYEVEARQYLAEAYFHDYQEDAAIAELRLLGQQEPENQYVWSALGAYLTILGRHQDARPPLERYLELAPEEPNAFNLMGDLHREMGDFQAATGYFNRALEFDPQFTLSQLGLAEVKAALGEMTDAKQRLNTVIDNVDAEPEDRITGAFDLAWILRAEGAFDESSQAIGRVENEIRAEKIRESMALALDADNHLDLGDHEQAGRLLTLAVERALRAPTRYLFARALMEIRLGHLDQALATANEIRTHALPPDDPDRTEEKAAIFIEGTIALQSDDAVAAIDKFHEAITLEGYRYAIYKRGLAEALKKSGDLAAAQSLAAEARLERDPGNLRLDLERERALAHRLEIQLAAELGDSDRAADLSRDFATRWGRAELTGMAAGPGIDLGSQPD